MIIPGSNLTFQKWFMNSANENNCKTDLNVGCHGWERKFFILYCLFTCLSDWKTSEWHLWPGDSYNKRFVLKELCKNSFENILNQIMWNSAYLQKRIISASMRTMQIKLLLSRLIFNNLTKLTKILLSRGKKINVKGSGM